MLLRELNSSLHPNMVKHVAEIILDSMGDSKYYEYLDENKCFTKDGFKELREALTETNYNKDIDKLIESIKHYLLKNGVKTILHDYCYIGKMKNILKSKIQDYVKHSVSMEDFNKILIDFLKVFEKNSQHQYPFDSGSCGGWIVNSFFFYCQSPKSSKFIFNTINEKGSLVNGEDGEVSLGNLLEVSMKEKTSNFSFREDVYNIFEASKLLFPLNARVGGGLYLDIVTNYKIYKINSKLDSLCNSIETVYCPRKGKINKERFLSDNSYFTRIVVERPLELYQSDYRIATYKIRNDITNELYKYIGKRLRAEDIEALYTRVLEIDQFGVTSNNIGVMLNYKSEDPYDVDENKEKFMKLLKGLLSLNQLVKYCNDNDLDIFSIPEEIFRTSNYYKRFNTLEECMKCFRYTSKLIQEARDDAFNPLDSNDSFYNTLSSKANYNFLSMKELIESFMNNESQGTKAGTYYNKVCKDYDHYYNKLIEVVKYVLNNYGQFSDAAFHTDDDELIYKLHACLPVSHIKKVANIAKIKLAYVDALCRYSVLRVTILKNLKNTLSSLIGDSDFDKIQKIDNSEIFKLPGAIHSLEDISSLKIDSVLINRVANLDEDDEIDERTLNDLSEFYDFTYKEYEEIIKFTNIKFDELLRNYERDGIEIGLAFTLSEKLILASTSIYLSREVIQNASFNKLKQNPLFKIKQGYVFKKNTPLMHQGCFIHDSGWLVAPDGDVISSLTEDDKF